MGKKELERFEKLLDAYSDVAVSRDVTGDIIVYLFIKGSPTTMQIEKGHPVRVAHKICLKHTLTAEEANALEVEVYKNTDLFDRNSFYRENPDDKFLLIQNSNGDTTFQIEKQSSTLGSLRTLTIALQGLELLSACRPLPHSMRTLHVNQVNDNFPGLAPLRDDLLEARPDNPGLMQTLVDVTGGNPFLSLSYTTQIVKQARQSIR